MRIGSLFSGYGGLDLACESFFDAETAWHCEWDDAPSKILAHHWPDVPNYRDVTEIDWTAMPPVDILTGGYPCQPFSAAGQRKGADDERHLWPYVREAIRHLRPRYTVLENVAGHRSLGFDRVLGDLAEDGLNVWWTSLRASDIGAPHHRERLFILATPANAEGKRLPGQQQSIRTSQTLPRDNGGLALLPNTSNDRRHQQHDRTGCNETCRGRQWFTPRSGRIVHSSFEWGTYRAAIQRWERLTRTAPDPTELNRNGNMSFNPRFGEWMMGLPDGHVTSVPGLSKAHQLKAIGNGVCPPQAFAAIGQLASMAQLRERVA